MLGLSAIGDLPLAGEPSPLTALPPRYPFYQSSWPPPLAPRLATDYRSWEWRYNRNLVGKDKFPSGRTQFTTLPTPDIRQIRRFAYFWEWQYNKNLIGKDKLPFRQSDWPLPSPDKRENFRRSWEWWYNPNLIGKDALPPGDFRTLLPPRGGYYPLDLRTWIDTGNALTTGPIVLPFNQFDWPVPKGPEYSVQLRSWTWQYNPNLIGKDQLPVGDNRSLLTPRIVNYPVDLRTWINQGITSVTQAPFAQDDWPVPQQPQFPISLRTWINQGIITAVPTPFAQDDWPLPQGYQYPVGLRSWTYAYNSNLIGQDVVPGERSLDLPPRDPREPRSWTWSYNRNLVGKDQLPFNQDSWPIPTGYPYPLDLRTWIGHVTITVAMPFSQDDWQLPQTIQYPTTLRTWAFTYNPNLTAQDRLPFRQQDWPNPIAPAQPSRFAQPTALTLRAPPVRTIPFNQFDWPLPGHYVPLSQAQSYSTPLPLAPPPAPARVFEWIVRARRRKVR